MDTKKLLEAKKSLENKILLAIEKELDSFHNETGLAIDEINVSFAKFVRYDGSVGSISPEKVTCKIFLE